MVDTRVPLPPDTLAALINVEASYGGRRVLGPFSLTLEPARTVALVGPSGCGKSTALRFLAGLEQPHSGEVIRRLGVGDTAVVFQAPTLAPWATALDNVALPLRLRGEPVAVARQRADDALARVGLSSATQLKPQQLSGGMAMRVSLARALVANPRLLLLDEPFAALDEITRRRLAEDVQRLTSELGPAVVFVTHSVEEAVFMADDIIVMAPSPGREFARFAFAAETPRAAHFRTSISFREQVETVSESLAAAMSEGAP